jgi:hypothetical protein
MFLNIIKHMLLRKDGTLVPVIVNRFYNFSCLRSDMRNFQYANMIFYHTFTVIVWFVSWIEADGDATTFD